MGGKKKGGLANRLARMTDDERAKYLQRKADMEEEARRRKEQLVTNFMKNKLKKEDAFSRLNMAKINQYWHHIMRADKCKDMKQEVEHLRKWIDRTVKLKNRTIQKLMDELDWQEDLYGKNFDAHSGHVDKILGFHNKNLDELRNQYEDDRQLLLHIGKKERKDFEERTGNEIEHLKTIIYGQQVQAEKSEKENHESYVKQIDEILSTYRTDLNQMQKSREKISCAIWRQMSKILSAYIHQTDAKRSHLAELKRLDTEGSLAIAKNQQQITQEEEQLEKLKEEHATLVNTREEQIKFLEDAVKLTNSRFLQIRKKLNSEISHDEKKLTHLSDVSNAVIKNLEKLAKKGEQILQMVQTCRKLESEDEKTNRWSPFIDEGDLVTEKDEEDTDIKSIESGVKSKYEDYKPKFSWDEFNRALEESLYQSNSSASETPSSSKDSQEEDDKLEDLMQPELSIESLTETETKEMVVQGLKSVVSSKIRPKTSVPSGRKQILRKLRSEETFKKSEETPVFHITTRLIKAPSQDRDIKFAKKSLSVRPTKSALISKRRISASASRKSEPTPDSKAFPSPSDSLLKSPQASEGGFGALGKLDGLWWVYNKVQMDCIDIKQERKKLMQENNKLKDITRNVLAAAALGQSIPSAKSSISSASKRRFILSAPLSSYSVF